MSLMLRIASMTIVFALLAGPFELANWPLGAALSLPAALAIGGLRPISPGAALRVLFLPWFLFGILLRTISSAAQLSWLLLVRRDWDAVDFLSCPPTAESRPGRLLLALAETASPGGIVVSAEEDLVMSSMKADRPDEQCRELQSWHRRFQRPMTG